MVRAKLILQKCLSQFSRKQQMHAQQAVRYLRGFKDGIPSHETTPMLSALLVSYCHKMYSLSETEHGESAQQVDETDDFEDPHLSVVVDHVGRVRESNQIDDYLHRSGSLEQMNFYDFCRCVSREKITSEPKSKRLGVRTRHSLLPSHPLSDQYHLVQHTDEVMGYSRQLIPKVIGCPIPRKDNTKYRLFVLAHFKPFSAANPLIPHLSNPADVFEAFQFSQNAKRVIHNWEAIHECEDERDADRLRKRAAEATASRNKTQKLVLSDLTDDASVILNSSPSGKAAHEIAMFIHSMKMCNWLSPQCTTAQLPVFNESLSENPLALIDVNGLHITGQMQVQWKQQIVEQEKAVVHLRRAALNPGGQDMLSSTLNETEAGVSLNKSSTNPFTELPSVATDTPNINMTDTVSIADLVQRVGDEMQLNRQQWKAYRIIALHFIDTCSGLRTECQTAPLRMILTGPGGTGKSHVVKAVQKVMNHFQKAHLLRCLAPTGGAAAGINGMTIHKGLALSVKKKDKGKGSRVAGESKEDYSVLLSIKQRSELQAEWENVKYLMIDEVSMTGTDLVASIDSALRYAKQEPNLWFGGISLIFCGDFYQFPPVAATPLYKPLSVNAKINNSEIQNRLGRLAFKTIDTVITLVEQNRMASDPEFAQAISRLRVRSCTVDDMDLFNTRVMKSPLKEDGIDLGLPEFRDANVIVQTNHLRQQLNMEKAIANCRQDISGLVMVAAEDFSKGNALDGSTREALVQRNFTSEQGSLPGMLPLYLDMPVILRHKNISTDLGITNGAQGIVKKIVTRTCRAGMTVCDLVVVHFPSSRIRLQSLPDGCFPIVPISWSCTTILDGEKIRFTRKQLPIEPAFAVTGQSAQGKTLPKVIVNLHEGGFAAYVAASRPRRREDLVITQEITKLDQLNKPLPADLRTEMRRFEALEHNTNVRHGFLNADYVNVPDTEGEEAFARTTFSATFLTPETKRKRVEDPESIISIKRRCGQTPILKSSIPPAFPWAGCRWDHVNWSCAYDSVFMSLFWCYVNESEQGRFDWSACSSSLLPSLAQAFISLLSSSSTAADFDTLRNLFRTRLHSLDGGLFPSHGPALAPAIEAINIACGNEDIALRWNVTACPSCKGSSQGTLLPIFAMVEPDCTDSAHYLNRLIQKSLDSSPTPHCDACCPCFPSSPKFLIVECQPPISGTVSPSDKLEIQADSNHQSWRYELRAAVYLGASHFTARLVSGDHKTSYDHDGIVNGGIPISRKLTSLSSLTKHGDKVAVAFVYAVCRIP